MSYPALKFGDKIAIVAPSGYTAPTNLTKAKKYLQSLGFKVSAPKTILQKSQHFANTDQKRFLSLKKALLDSEVKAIWCLRGGSGAQRLIPYLDLMDKPENKKILIGLSDISVLHLFFNQRWHWPSLHAPVLNRMLSNKQTKKEHKMIWDSLNGNLSEQVFSKLKPLNNSAKKSRGIQAKVSGGNMATLQSSLGSRVSFRGENKIIFLEDIAEAPYRINRMLVSLMQANSFHKAKAIVFGDFTDCKGSPGVQKELSNFAQEINIPVFKGIKSGHGKIQLPIWFGSNAKLSNCELRVKCPIR